MAHGRNFVKIYSVSFVLLGRDPQPLVCLFAHGVRILLYLASRCPLITLWFRGSDGDFPRITRCFSSGMRCGSIGKEKFWLFHLPWTSFQICCSNGLTQRLHERLYFCIPLGSTGRGGGVVCFIPITVMYLLNSWPCLVLLETRHVPMTTLLFLVAAGAFMGNLD